MARFLMVRAALIVATLLMVSLAIFVITEILPGDVATKILGQFATEQNVKNLREELGLDRPAPERYGSWVWGVVRGDFGDSLVQRRAISEIVLHRLWPSVYLAIFAFLIAVPSAILVGIWAGVRRTQRATELLALLAWWAYLCRSSSPDFC
jgi:peptide/nickel transport system permease protein